MKLFKFTQLIKHLCLNLFNYQLHQLFDLELLVVVAASIQCTRLDIQYPEFFID